MDFLYALTLIVAMAAAAVAVLSILMSRRIMNSALALGFVSLAISIVVHSRWGHGPGTVAPMDLGRLLADHEAFPTVGAILLLALVLALYRNRRRR